MSANSNDLSVVLVLKQMVVVSYVTNNGYNHIYSNQHAKIVTKCMLILMHPVCLPHPCRSHEPKPQLVSYMFLSNVEC